LLEKFEQGICLQISTSFLAQGLKIWPHLGSRLLTLIKDS